MASSGGYVYLYFLLITSLVLNAKEIFLPQIFYPAKDLFDSNSPYWKDGNISEKLSLEAQTRFNIKHLKHSKKCQENAPLNCNDDYYRRIDGFCNNKNNPEYGASLTTLARMLQPVYDRGVMRMVGEDGKLLPNPRVVSNSMKLMEQRRPTTDTNILWVFFGQFIDHDLVSTVEIKDVDCSECNSWKLHSACAPILVPLDDEFFPPFNKNGKRKCISFKRTSAIPVRYNGAMALQQLNENTAFLDLSTVYGSNKCRENSLRLHHIGQLIEHKSPFESFGLPPLEMKSSTRDCRNINQRCHLTGDDRNIEQLGIMLFHVLFLREHNRLAKRLYELNNHWTDERIFQEARKINIAQYQKIIYEEFLPSLLGQKIMDIYNLSINTKEIYTGYNEHINPQVAIEFATAAFRMGHTLLPNHIIKMDKRYFPIGSLPLEEIFLNTSIVYQESIFEDITRGMIASRIKGPDPIVETTLRDKLFIKKANPLTGADLIAINIARGRDHGLPGYTAYRRLCGFKDLNSWEEMKIQKKDLNLIKNLYSSVNDIDLFLGGLMESPIEGSLLGPTFTCIITQQFLRSKNGDRYWFEDKNQFTPDQLNAIKEISGIRKILSFNLNKSYLPRHPFSLPDKQKNRLLIRDQDINLEFWKENAPVPRECRFKDEIYYTWERVDASPCLSCFCQAGKILCRRNSSKPCIKHEDESCKLICGS